MSKTLIINGKLMWLSAFIIGVTAALVAIAKLDQSAFIGVVGIIGGYYYGNMRAFYKRVN